MSRKKIIILLLVLALLALYFIFDLGQYISLKTIKAQQASIDAYYLEKPLSLVLIYFVCYVAITGLSLPGAAILTLLGGAIFGLLWGTIIVSFASTIGAVLAFLLSRLMLYELVQKKFASKLQAINAGFARDGGFYLFTLRLVPIFPFFVVNLVMALTPIPLRTFAIVSQVAMLPGTMVYVNAGMHLGSIDSLAGILSPMVIASFTLLGLFPLIAKKIVVLMKAQRLLKKFTKPKKYDCNLIVIGAGSAGLVSAYLASSLNAKVTLIEDHKMGGDCLNTGCVPSKALIKTASVLAMRQQARALGLQSITAKYSFSDIWQRIARVISDIEPHDSIERYAELGVDCLQGRARILSPYSVSVNGRVLTTRSIILATGARPLVPKIPGIASIKYYTSETIWSLTKLPRQLLVLGGGAIGCELGQCFARLGSKVTLVEMAEQLLPKEDRMVGDAVLARLVNDGVGVLLNHTINEFTMQGNTIIAVCSHSNKEKIVSADTVLLALGRVANVNGFGLEELGVKLNDNNSIAVNNYLQTNYPNIFACGDNVGPYQFTHAAAYQAQIAVINALFGHVKLSKTDYSVMPWATFTSPEVARVGLDEQQALAQHVPYELSHYELSELDRAIIDEQAVGWLQVLTVPGKDKILGVTIVGEHAAEMLAEFVLAMKYGIGLNKILNTTHIYPTFGEANKYVAGIWKRNHAPQRVLSWLRSYHRWRCKLSFKQQR